MLITYLSNCYVIILDRWERIGCILKVLKIYFHIFVIIQLDMEWTHTAILASLATIQKIP